MNIVLVAREEIDPDGTARLADARGRHVRDVLHAAPGQVVRIGLLDGPYGTGTIAAVNDTIVELRCAFEETPPARPRVDLLLALPRPKVLRRLWAQLAALGVGRIMLTNAQRVERNYFDAHLLSPAIFTPLLIEGLQQARDTRLPLVTEHRQFKVLIEDDLDALVPDACRLVLHPGDEANLGEVVRRRGSDRVLLAIGPEGGWNDFELGLLCAHGFQATGMGPRTLRTDTACVAALAVVHGAMSRAEPRT